MKEAMHILKHDQVAAHSHTHRRETGDSETNGNHERAKLAHSRTQSMIMDIMNDEDLEHEETLVSKAAVAKAQDKHWLIDSRGFQILIFVTIVLNAAQMGLAIDAPDILNWEIAESVFTAIFAAEMCIKVAILKNAYFSDGWNRMDAILVTMSIVDVWIIAPLAKTGGSSVMSQLSVLRVLRICRVARMVRLLKVFKELFVILLGIFQSLRTILWVVLLLAFVLYACSILCVEIMGREGTYPGFDDSEEAVSTTDEVLEFNNFVYFGNIPRSMITLFGVVITAEFEGFGRPMIEKQPLMTLFFLGFVIFTTFGILNVIIGVIVDNVAEAARETEADRLMIEKKRKLQILGKLREMVFTLDVNGNGAISLAELEEGWSNPEFRELLESVELPKGWTAQELMWLLDPDGDHELQFDNFIKSFFRLLFSTDPFQQNCCVQVSLNYIKSKLYDLTNEFTYANMCQNSERLEQKLESISQTQESVSGTLMDIRERLEANDFIPSEARSPSKHCSERLEQKLESISQTQESVCETLKNICERLKVLELHSGVRGSSKDSAKLDEAGFAAAEKRIAAELKALPPTPIPTAKQCNEAGFSLVEV